MARIKLTPDEMRRIGDLFKRKSQESDSMVNELSSTMRNAESEWEGMASQRFYQEFVNWEKSMKDFVGLLNNIGMDLDKVADAFAQTDQSLAGR